MALWSVVTDVLTSKKAAKEQTKAATEAAAWQQEYGEKALAEQRRQYDIAIERLAPFAGGGTQAFQAQGSLVGLAGPEAERAAIESVKSSPEFAELTRQGEEAILQNAAATGGLRGGNVQLALANNRQQILSQLINDRFARLGGLSGLGQASSAGQAAAGQNFAGTASNTLTSIGGAQAAAAQDRGFFRATRQRDFAAAQDKWLNRLFNFAGGF